MKDILIKQWNADPNGEMTVRVYQETGLKAAIRGIFRKRRTVDVPSGVAAHLYEPVPVTIRANQHLIVMQGDWVVMTG